jgi:hypothetical protein
MAGRDCHKLNQCSWCPSAPRTRKLSGFSYGEGGAGALTVLMVLQLSLWSTWVFLEVLDSFAEPWQTR